MSSYKPHSDLSTTNTISYPPDTATILIWAANARPPLLIEMQPVLSAGSQKHISRVRRAAPKAARMMIKHAG
jgi:hypothetical protein